MVRSPSFALLASLALVATACEGGQSSSGAPPSELEVEALRHELFAAGIQPLTDAPAVSDELFALGQALFFDKLLSGNQDISCATCHLPEFGTSDGRNLPDGVHGFGFGPDRGGGTMIPRNSPALFNVHAKGELFWDGRVERTAGALDLPPAVDIPDELRAVFTPGLEVAAAQAMLPPVSREEMRGAAGENPLGDLGDGYNSGGGQPEHTRQVWDELTQILLDQPGYVALLQAAYPGVALDEFTFAHAGNALAAFETRAFARSDSPFERFVRGDDQALTQKEVRGALVFFGEGCASCHSGALFTDGEFHNIGLPQLGPGVSDFAFAGFAGPDLGRELASGSAADAFKFRTPSLLNVALTAPYGHAGQFAELADMVAHYEDPAVSNLTYDVQANVTDPRLVTLLWPGSPVVLNTIDARLDGPNEIDVGAVVDFLEALTADDARDLSALVPSSVPSGLPIF